MDPSVSAWRMFVCLAIYVAIVMGAVPNTDFSEKSLTLTSAAALYTCSSDDQFVAGFNRKMVIDTLEDIASLRCGHISSPYLKTNVPYQCKLADWRTTMATANAFNLCPNGHFLFGMDMVKGGSLTSMRYGKCCKPANAVNYFERCYFPTITSKEQAPKCDRGFFISGFQTKCSTGLDCITRLKCCKMLRIPPVAGSHSDVKTQVMDMTQKDLALLAHFMGFRNSFGCWAQNVGEGFVRNGDSWEADNKFGCSETDRLKIRYTNFGFAMKGVPKIGKTIMSSITPEMLLTGLIVNDDDATVDHSLTRTVSTRATVTNTVTHGFSVGFGVSFTIGAEATFLGNTLGTTVNFGMDIDMEYEKSKSTTVTETNEVSQTITKSVPARTAMRYRVMMSRVRATVPYVALLKIKFKVQFEGTLKAGEHFNKLQNGKTVKNFRQEYGSASVPFYKELSDAETQGRLPWDWIQMKGAFPDFRTVLESVKQEGWYLFPIHGKFDGVSGSHTYVTWNEFPSSSPTAQSKAPLQKTPDAPEVPRKDDGITVLAYTQVNIRAGNH